MEYLAVDAGTHAGTLRVTVLGCVVICLVLLVLYHVLVAKKAFVTAAAGYANSNAYAINTGVALRLQDQDQVGVGKGRAGFQGGAEPPVFWGSSGGSELSNDQQMNIGAEGADMNADSSSADSSSANFSARGKAGFAMKDEHLIQIARGR